MVLVTVDILVDGTVSRTALGKVGSFITRWANDPAPAPDFSSYPETVSIHNGTIATPTESVFFGP